RGRTGPLPAARRGPAGGTRASRAVRHRQLRPGAAVPRLAPARGGDRRRGAGAPARLRRPGRLPGGGGRVRAVPARGGEPPARGRGTRGRGVRVRPAAALPAPAVGAAPAPGVGGGRLPRPPGPVPGALPHLARGGGCARLARGRGGGG